MNTKQLKDLVAKIESLKTADKSADFQAGVDAAKEVINSMVHAALDRERIQKLERELAELRSKYPETSQAAPRRRGRKPKAV